MDEYLEGITYGITEASVLGPFVVPRTRGS